MSRQNTRQAPRAPIELKVEYRRLNAFIADYTHDLSRGGLFIKTERPLDEGTECLFTLHVPSLAEQIALRGVVRRVVPPGGEAEAGMGVELIFDDEDERKALRTVVDGLMIDHLGMALYERMMRMRNQPGRRTTQSIPVVSQPPEEP